MRKARWLFLALVLTGCAHAPSPMSADALLQQAIDAAGGEAALSQAQVLAWTGEAVVVADGQRIELGVDTSVEPFTQARSDTWLRDRGRSTLRSLEIDGDQGWMTRDGQRTAMPIAMQRHERAQYAVYGLMRLVTLRDAGANVQALPDDPDGLHGLRVSHPQAPTAELYFHSDGRLAYLTNSVPAPDGDGSVAQRFDFQGAIEADGVRWPRTLRISQSGQPYFELHLLTFHATPKQ